MYGDRHNRYRYISTEQLLRTFEVLVRFRTTVKVLKWGWLFYFLL